MVLLVRIMHMLTVVKLTKACKIFCCRPLPGAQAFIFLIPGFLFILNVLTDHDDTQLYYRKGHCIRSERCIFLLFYESTEVMGESKSGNGSRTLSNSL